MNTQALFCLSLPLVIAGCAQQTSTSTARDSAFAQSLRPPVFSDIYQRSPEVTRSGRYTLVSVKSADAQREPLNQLIDITMPGYLAREGYESQMALAVISLANTVNHIAERDQHDNRDIVFTIDEAHVVTANPLVSPYFAKISKMWRKLGTWLWLATQNLKDYPDTAEKMLNMAEWWICLTMPPDEIEQIARFRSLTEEQKAMLASARKGEKKNGIPCYTEGVVLARNWNALFRSVPPSLYLALGMTEKDEKAQRRELMKTHQCSELEAVFMVARNLDERRGVSV